MLEKLYIKNYLIIKDAKLEFKKGLNILTGETGAGKTIILDALMLILGERADYSIISSESEKLIIEGHFEFGNNKSVLRFLKENDLFSDSEDKGCVIVRRELTKKGSSRNFINDTPVNISSLKEFGNLIIDIHSQNEHQSLLKKEMHIDFLDGFMSDKKITDTFVEKYSEYKILIQNYNELTGRKEELAEKRGFIEFQLKEINNVNPLPGEDDELENNLKKMENSEEISVSLDNAINIIYENENNVLAGLLNSIKELKKAAKYDVELERLISTLESGYHSIKDSAEELRGYAASVVFDPLQIEQVRTRLGALTFLRKKYKMTMQELIDKAEALTKELNLSENFDFELEKLEKEISVKKKALYDICKELSKNRKKTAKELEKRVNSYLKEVGLDSAEFMINFEIQESGESDNYSIKDGGKNIKITSNGIDDVEFLIKANKGGEFTPLRKTASGGEISRIMLSLKASTSGKDNVPILVFDEIDAGISGKIAGKVGKLLRNLSASHQIISITHLPQIAALSDNHFYISKNETNKKTIAEITVLNENEKIKEVARLLSSEKITDASLNTAKELIKEKIKH
ncbi:MAG: DNA repair protein RecN [Ignavibacteria bacterium]|nr:DNA repair protein RecN [Ignavibacteria bacterium]